MKKQRLQESWNPKTPVTPSIKFQAWNSPALDKEENATFSETINDDVPIIFDKTDESEVSQEDVKGKGMFTIDSENREAWMAKFKEQCEKAAAIGCKEVGTVVKQAMKKAMEEIRIENGTEEILDNEENDSFEDVKKWAVNQKQSITSE